MKFINTAALILTITSNIMFLNSAHAAPDPEICKFRGQMMEGVARGRDDGLSKTRATEILQKQFEKKSSSLAEMIDIVYVELKDMSPKQVAAAFEYACLRGIH